MLDHTNLSCLSAIVGYRRRAASSENNANVQPARNPGWQSAPVLLMPSGGGGGLFGQRGDLIYAIFVGVIVVLSVVAAIVFYRRSPPDDQPH